MTAVTSLPELEAGWCWARVTDASLLLEGGAGCRFSWQGPREKRPAFVVRYDGAPRAYLNRCAHVAVELDWDSGRFFDASGLFLICATHGAHYDAADGRCLGGPCAGRSLAQLRCVEHDGGVWIAMQEKEDE